MLRESIMLLKSREIAEDFNFTLPQVRRWAVLVLGIDPEADKGKGKIREYSLDEAFKIFLMGELVNDYRMGLNEAKDTINSLWPHLSKLKLLPSQITSKNDIPDIDLIIDAGENYKLRKRISVDNLDNDGFDYDITYRITSLNKTISFKSYSGPWKSIREIYLSYELRKFMRRIAK